MRNFCYSTYLSSKYAPHTFFDRNIHTIEGGSLTEGKNLLYLLDMSYKVYKINFSDKIDKKKFDKMKVLK